jgi:hypothetical protein
MNLELLNALLAAGLIDQDTVDALIRNNDPNEAALWAEQLLTQRTQAALSAQQGRLLDLVESSGLNPTAPALEAFWRREDDLLWDAMRPTLLQIASERAAFEIVRSGQVGTFSLINQRVLDWVSAYYVRTDLAAFGSVPNLNLSARTQFAQAFARWQTGELPFSYRPGLPGLIQLLQPTFGPVRAEAIGVTETTRVFINSLLEVERNNPFTTGFRYSTARDSRVSEICRPAEGLIIEKGQAAFPDGGGFPPRHVRCRSGVQPVTVGSRNVPNIRDTIAALEAN